MKRLAIATVLVALASLALRANAITESGCCACLNLNSTVNATAQPAIFCAAPSLDEIEQVGQRCEMTTPGAALVCYKVVTNGSCQAQLAGAGIICPNSPAPAAGSLSLAALAVGLAGVGALFLHRRRRSA